MVARIVGATNGPFVIVAPIGHGGGKLPRPYTACRATARRDGDYHLSAAPRARGAGDRGRRACLPWSGVPRHVGDIAYADEDGAVLMPASA